MSDAPGKRTKGEHLSEKEVTELLSDIRAGVRVGFLAAKYRCSSRVIYKHRERAGLGGASNHGCKIEARGFNKSPEQKPTKPIPPPNCIPSVAHKVSGAR